MSAHLTVHLLTGRKSFKGLSLSWCGMSFDKSKIGYKMKTTFDLNETNCTKCLKARAMKKRHSTHFFVGVQESDGRLLTLCGRGFYEEMRNVFKEWTLVNCVVCLKKKKGD